MRVTLMAPVIAFNRPPNPPLLAQYLAGAAGSDHHGAGGPYGERARSVLAAEFPGAAAVFLTTSCTHALELAALLVDVGPGDEVIVPSFTFVTTATAFALRGATVRFADIDPTTLCIDLSAAEQLIGPTTRALVTMHYAGVGVTAASGRALADAHGIAFVEDAALGLFGRHDDRPVGSHGAVAALSFHETKHISAGEGGAAIINDAALVERAQVALDHGTDRARFRAGLVDHYSWIGPGSSWSPSEFQAAALLAGLEHAPVSQRRRHTIWSRYHAAAGELLSEHGISPLTIPDGSKHPASVFALLAPSRLERDELIAHLRDSGVQAAFHYSPLHNSVGGQRVAMRPGDGDGTAALEDHCPVAEHVSSTILRLPLYEQLSDAEVDRVIAALASFRR